MSNFRKQFVHFGTRGKNILDVVIGHNDHKISCEAEQNTPEDCDHTWLKVLLEVDQEVLDEKLTKTKTLFLTSITLL